jgi:2-keto-4-pentenoate hydratase
MTISLLRSFILAGMLAGTFALTLAEALAQTACGEPDPSAQIVAGWLDKQPLRGLPQSMSLDVATCVRERVVAGLMPTQGRVVGYKAALTNPDVQKKFGAPAPIRGTLLARMLTMESAFPVEVKFAARPVFEADMLVEVGDDAINDARTPLEALRALSRVYPFIELADLVMAEGEPLNAAVITAINAGARGGIFGRAIDVEPTQQFADALRDMRVVMTDEQGRELANAPGAAILGHPLNAVLWLVEDLRKSGVRLKVGDRLSLGAFSPPLAPRAEMRVNVRYQGLPGDPRINVRFK